jgi:tetratricopeptide (TPR) repeat protein
MQTACEWLDTLNQNARDLKWLKRNEDDLFQAVHTGLNRPQWYHCAADLLLYIFPYFSTIRAHHQRWSPLLLVALMEARLLMDSGLQVRILTQVGDSYILHSQPNPAREVFNQALERAIETHTDDHMLAAYIGLVNLEAMNMSHHFNEELVKRVLTLAKQLGKPESLAAAYQAIASAYAYRKETFRALSYGQMAYTYWYQLNNEVEMAKTAFTLASACRAAKRYEQAERYLALSQTQFSRTEYVWQYAISAYEEGALKLKFKQYDLAQEWLENALQEFQLLKSPYHLAAIAHALGLVETELGNFSAAASYLDMAADYWYKTDNTYEKANITFARAYLELKSKHLQKADALKAEALALSEAIPDEAARAQLVEQIREEIP